MKREYYLKNIYIGLFFLCVYLIKEWGELFDRDTILFIFVIVSCFLTPFSKYFIELIASKLTTRDFWNTGIFIDTPGKMGGFALYYLFCFVAAIPLSIIYLIFSIFKKNNHSPLKTVCLRGNTSRLMHCFFQIRDQ